MSPMSLKMLRWCSWASSTTARASSSLYGGIEPFADCAMSVTSIAPLLPKFDIPKHARDRPRTATLAETRGEDARF